MLCHIDISVNEISNPSHANKFSILGFETSFTLNRNDVYNIFNLFAFV